MKTKIIEVTNGPLNWGKFLLGVLDVEWERRSVLPGYPGVRPLLQDIGWQNNKFMLMDLQTQEGAFFIYGQNAKMALDRHKVWVCPMYEPFLAWLQRQPRFTVFQLDVPEHLDLPDAEFSFRGYRRTGTVTGKNDRMDESDKSSD